MFFALHWLRRLLRGSRRSTETGVPPYGAPLPRIFREVAVVCSKCPKYSLQILLVTSAKQRILRDRIAGTKDSFGTITGVVGGVGRHNFSSQLHPCGPELGHVRI